MNYIDCKKVKNHLLNNLKKELKTLKKLSVVDITVNNTDISNIYIKQKETLFKSLNINYLHLNLNNNIKESDILNIIDVLNYNDSIDGITITLPLPSSFNYDLIVNRINYLKDIDCLTKINRTNLISNKHTPLPSTVLAIMEIFKYYSVRLNNKLITIIGNGKLVGNPLSILLKNKNYKVVICDSKTKNLKEYTKKSDIIISATGKNINLTQSMLKENVIIIDAGIHIENNSIKGDIDTSNLINFNCSITPVPNGIGILTTICLIENLLNCYNSRR